MALLDDILTSVGRVGALAGDVYLLERQRAAEAKATKDRAAAERAQAEATLLSAKVNSDTIARVGKYAMYAAAAMLGITLLAQLRRMWKTR